MRKEAICKQVSPEDKKKMLPAFSKTTLAQIVGGGGGEKVRIGFEVNENQEIHFPGAMVHTGTTLDRAILEITQTHSQ